MDQALHPVSGQAASRGMGGAEVNLALNQRIASSNAKPGRFVDNLSTRSCGGGLSNGRFASAAVPGSKLALACDYALEEEPVGRVLASRVGELTQQRGRLHEPRTPNIPQAWPPHPPHDRQCWLHGHVSGSGAGPALVYG
jgi:hypothetical protein